MFLESSHAPLLGPTTVACCWGVSMCDTCASSAHTYCIKLHHNMGLCCRIKSHHTMGLRCHTPQICHRMGTRTHAQVSKHMHMLTRAFQAGDSIWASACPGELVPPAWLQHPPARPRRLLRVLLAPCASYSRGNSRRLEPSLCSKRPF